MASLRVVLDTNVLLSGIAYPASVPGKILAAWRHGSVDVLLSAYILEELRRVLPRFMLHRHGLSSSEINDLIDALSIQAELVEPLGVADQDLRDVDDQPVLGTLSSALQTMAADYLITGDKDLVALAERYPILTPRAVLGSACWALVVGN